MEKRKWHYASSFFISIYCLITVILFAVVIWNSLKSREAVFSNIWSLPTSLEFANYYKLLITDKFNIYVMNSVLITVVSTAIAMYISALAAYGLAKFKFRYSGPLLIYFLIGLMFPSKLGIIPLYIMIRDMGLNNTLIGVIFVYSAGISVTIFILTGYMKTIPDSIIESAKIDGAGHFLTFNKIVLPLCKPALGAAIPLFAVQTWNDFFIPLVLLTKDEVKTIPLGLMKYFIGPYFDLSKFELVFTAASVSILPILIIYFIASDKIVSGMTSGSSK